MTETYVNYVGNKAVIVHVNVLVNLTLYQLLSMIFSRTSIDKEKCQIVLNCRYLLKMDNWFQPCLI